MEPLGPSILPTGYKPITYIETTDGLQRIDPDVVRPVTGFSFETKIQLMKLADNCILGNMTQGRCFFHMYYSSYLLGIYNDRTGGTYTAGKITTVKGSLEQPVGYLDADGTRVVTIENFNNWSGESKIYLFNWTSTSYTDNIGKRMYYCKLFIKGELVRDFIPVLDRDKRPCLFDKVSRRAFYNIGPGEFTYA